jgi:hypothetical protein
MVQSGVSEPSTCAMMLLGFAGIGFIAYPPPIRIASPGRGWEQIMDFGSIGVSALTHDNPESTASASAGAVLLIHSHLRSGL